MFGQLCELPPGPREPGAFRGAGGGGVLLGGLVEPELGGEGALLVVELVLRGALVALELELAAFAIAAPPPASAPVAASVASSGVSRMYVTSFRGRTGPCTPNVRAT